MGETEQARSQFEAILRLTPGDRDNIETYVAILAESDQLADAVKVLQSLIEQQPGDGELRLRLAALQHKSGDAKGAAAAVEQYLEKSDKSEYAYLRAARVLQQLELFDAAGKAYEQLTAAHPESVAAKEAQAAFLYDRDKQDEALAIWRALAAGKGRSEAVHAARLMAARNEHQAAFDLLAPRFEQFSDDAVYLRQLLLEATALEKFAEALPWALRRVQLASTPTDLEAAVAQAALIAGRADQTQALIAKFSAAERLRVQDTCLLAELHEQTGASRQADQVLKGVENQQDLLVVSQQIRLHTQRRDWEQAAAAMRRLVETPEGRKSVYVRRLVELYERNTQYDEALRFTQEWKKLSPGSTMPWLTEARLLTTSGKHQQAVDVLRAAALQFEDDADLRAKLAKLYADAGQLADAERIYWRLYEDAKDLNGKLRWVQQLAEAAELQGKSQQLVEMFEERRQTNRTSIEPLLALAEIHRANMDYEEQRKVLLEATRLKSEDLPLLHQIARIEETEGDWERALATLQRAAKLDTTTGTKERIARLYLNFGEPEKGYAILYDIAGSQATDARSVEAIAEAMISVHDWQRAVEFLAAKVSQHPSDYRLQYLLALAREEEGDEAEAVQGYLALLKADQEISGLVATAPQTPWSGFIGPLVQLVPQESVDYLELSWLSELAYSHRGQNNRIYSVGYRGLNQSNVILPHEVAAARKFAMAHLITLAQSMDEDERKALAAAISAQGVLNTEVLLELSPNMQRMEQISDVARNHPDDEGIMGLQVLMNMEGRRLNEPELLKKAYDLFKGKRPQLALMAAMQVTMLDGEQAGLLDAALAAVPNDEQPNLFTVMSLASSLGGRVGFGPQTPGTLSDEQHKKLTQKLVVWYPQLTNLGPQGLMVFMVVARALSTSDDPAAYFAFLDDEIARSRSAGPQAGQGMMRGFFGGGRGEALFEPLDFPCTTLSSIPAHVLQMFSQDEGGPFGGLDESTSRFDEKTLARQIPKINDPILRILAAHRYEQLEVVQKTLDELLKAEQPQLDAYLLAAGKATVDGRSREAIDLLDKCRYLPMPREVRTRVDAALVAMATELADMPKQPDRPLVSGVHSLLGALGRLTGGAPASLATSPREVGPQGRLAAAPRQFAARTTGATGRRAGATRTQRRSREV